MRILLVSTTAIGDTMMATPFIRAVRQHYPEAFISAFVHQRRLSLLQHNPCLNEILPYYGKGKKLFRTLWTLRKRAFNLAIVLHANDPDIVPLVKWTGARVRAGWGESKWAKYFTHTIHRTHPPEHFMSHKKRLLESIGIPVADLRTEIFLKEEDEVALKQQILPWVEKNAPAKAYVAMHAFGSNPAKWWPLQHFFKVSCHIWKNQGRATVFVGDSHSLELVRRHPEFDQLRHWTASGCTLRESASILQHSQGMLTTDSGPMHLAFAVGCPTLCLFGPTHPSVHGPCFDLDRHHVLHRNPLSNLLVEEVVEAWDGISEKVSKKRIANP